MAGLLALVADLLAASRLFGTVTREVAILATVVALAAVDTLAWSRVSSLVQGARI